MTSRFMRGAVLVMRGNETVYEAVSGLADQERNLPVTVRTRFQIASVSKQFTAAAILRLVDEGRLDPSQAIARWFAGAPVAWHDITVHHLLTHTSGLGHWPDVPELDLTAWVDPAEVVAAFQRSELRSRPGATYYYSSPGYVLLAHIVERVTGYPYREVLTSRILAPVGLEETFVGSPAGHPDLARGHADGVPVPSFELDSLGMGAGDLWSTPADLVRWDRALTSGDLLSERSRELMFTPHVPIDAASAYGYGWRLGPLVGQGAIHHTGGNAGFRSLNAWFPEIDGYVVLMSNEEQGLNSDADLEAVTAPLVDRLLEVIGRPSPGAAGGRAPATPASR